MHELPSGIALGLCPPAGSPRAVTQRQGLIDSSVCSKQCGACIGQRPIVFTPLPSAQKEDKLLAAVLVPQHQPGLAAHHLAVAATAGMFWQRQPETQE